MSESIITDIYTGKFVLVQLVDETVELTVENNVYSLTEMMDLHQELVEAFDVTIKELKKLNHDVTYSEKMQEDLEPIDE